MLPASAPPPPGFGLQFVSIDSLKAALAKMDIKLPVDDIIRVVHEVEEAKHAETPSNRKSPATAARLLPFMLSNMLVPLHPPEHLSGLTPTPCVVEHPPRPDPLTIERRRRLMELTKEAFPGGRVQYSPNSVE